MIGHIVVPGGKGLAINLQELLIELREGLLRVRVLWCHRRSSLLRGLRKIVFIFWAGRDAPLIAEARWCNSSEGRGHEGVSGAVASPRLKSCGRVHSDRYPAGL